MELCGALEKINFVIIFRKVFMNKWVEQFTARDRSRQGLIYIPVRYKLILSFIFACLWFAASVYISYPWLQDLSAVFSPFLAWFIVLGLAFIPGLANAFIVSGLFLDIRPQYYVDIQLPPISLIIAAYNEEDNIRQTLQSVLTQNYPNTVEIIIVNDGSTDKTAEYVREFEKEIKDRKIIMKLLNLPANQGKAAALNSGFKSVTKEYVVTLDADSYLYKDSLVNLVNYMLHATPDTAAVAGSVLAHNSRSNWITKLQEWDYFHGIAVIKRIQSLYQGTLVAQGAYSIFKKHVLEECGGWTDTMGEDIVLTWGLHSRNYRVGYSENAIIFTNVPETYKQFYRQRKRWARGLIEAFKQHPEVIVKPRMNVPFIWYNFLFPYLDFVYFFAFLPGVIAAVVFHYYIIAGLMTILLLPLSLLINGLMFYKQKRVFKKMGLKVRQNILGFLFYMLCYQLIMTPACLAGYAAEILHLRKSWGTK